MFQAVGYRVRLASLGLLGPDFLMFLAIGQYESACNSVKTFKKGGYEGWTMKHAFFADMGGFLINAPDFGEFPINAEQLHFLVRKKFIMMPNLTEQEIDGKNKQDRLSRLITIISAIAFVANFIARLAQGLKVTSL